MVSTSQVQETLNHEEIDRTPVAGEGKEMVSMAKVQSEKMHDELDEVLAKAKSSISDFAEIFVLSPSSAACLWPSTI